MTTEQLRQHLEHIFLDDSSALSIVIMPEHESSKSDLPLPERLLSVLVDACLNVDLTNHSTDFHIEVLNMLLVLFSTQMYQNGQDSNLFLDLFFSRFTSKIAPFCEKLLTYFVTRVPTSAFSPMARSHTSLSWVSYIKSTFLNMFLWPFEIYRILFTKREANYLISDTAAYLLLILTHQPGDKVAFRNALSKITDFDNDFVQHSSGLVSFDRFFEVSSVFNYLLY